MEVLPGIIPPAMHKWMDSYVMDKGEQSQFAFLSVVEFWDEAASYFSFRHSRGPHDM